MSTSHDASSGDVLFEELRQFLSQAARQPVDKRAPEELGQHSLIIVAVWQTVFAQQDAQAAWSRTHQVMDLLLLEISKRPALCLYEAPTPAANEVALPALLGPWLVSTLLQVLGFISATPSIALAAEEQASTLAKVHQAVVLVIESMVNGYTLRGADAQLSSLGLVHGLFELATEISHVNSEGTKFDVYSSADRKACVVTLSPVQARSLEPRLLHILCDLVKSGPAAQHAAELLQLADRVSQRACQAAAKGKTKMDAATSPAQLLDACLRIAKASLASVLSQAHLHTPRLISSCCFVIANALRSRMLADAQDEGANTDLLLEQVSTQLYAMLNESTDEVASAVQVAVIDAFGSIISDLLERLEAEACVQQLKAATLYILLCHDFQPLASWSSNKPLDHQMLAACQRALPDKTLSLDLIQHIKSVLSVDRSSTRSQDPPPVVHSDARESTRKRKHAPAIDPSLSRNDWRPMIASLITKAAPNFSWNSNSEAFDTCLVRLVSSITEATDEHQRQLLIKVVGLAACAREGTLQWATDTTLDQAHCPHCDADLASPRPSKKSTLRPDRNLRGVALAALLKAQEHRLKVPFTATQRVSCLKTLTRLIRHSRPAAHGLDGLDPAKMLASCLEDESRLVRLASGNALAALLAVSAEESKAAGDESVAQPKLDLALRKLEASLMKKQRTFRQTGLIILSRLAQHAKDELLGGILQLLASHLGPPGVALADLVSVQLFNLAMMRETSTYKLFAPFLSTIAPFILRLRRSGTLDAFVDLIGVERRVFLKQNAGYMLPSLVIDQDMDGLEHIAAACDISIPELVAHHAAHLIAHLQLSTPAECRTGTTFMERLFGSDQSFESIFASCAAGVLFELVVEWGGLDARGDLAIRAIEKFVEQRATSARSVEKLLAAHLLAILALMNDLLTARDSTARKRKALSGLGRLISKVGLAISEVTPQVMATLQTSLAVPALRLPTLEAWKAFMLSLKFSDVGPFVGQTSAALLRIFTQLQPTEQRVAKDILEYLVAHTADLGSYASDMADLSAVSGLSGLAATFSRFQRLPDLGSRLQNLCNRVDSDNESVCLRGLHDLRVVLDADVQQIRELGAGDTFDLLLGQVMQSAIKAAIRSGDTWPEVKDLAFQCMGALGALDPDRLEMPAEIASFVVQDNFADGEEARDFSVDFIQHVLVRAYQSANDTKHQAALAYCIQQLLKFCQFTPALLQTSSKAKNAPSENVLRRWNRLPRSMVESIAPLLTSRFQITHIASVAPVSRPLYQHKTAYRDWVRDWVLDMITSVNEHNARPIFSSFLSVVKMGDVGVARRLIPHLVLHLVLCQSRPQALVDEILDVLQDQVRLQPVLPPESRLLCAQVIFDTMDHLGQWLRRKATYLAKRLPKTSRKNVTAIHEARVRNKGILQPVAALLAAIPQELQAEAARRCKSHARALLNIELRLNKLHSTPGVSQKILNDQFERLHEIYAELEEPDGMEGISTQIIDPSTLHRIREHESTGRWTAAQSCWEVELQTSPDSLESHTGLLKCLRNLGHYDSMRTHIVGLLNAHPDWRSALSPFEIEGSLIVGDWSSSETALALSDRRQPASVFASVVACLRSPSLSNADSVFTHARDSLGHEIMAAGQESYSRVYNAIIGMHILSEMELIYRNARVDDSEASSLALSARLDARLNTLSPAFRVREQVLSMRRTAFRLVREQDARIGRLWLETAKVARKAGHPQTAYSAALQAEKAHDTQTFLERVKLEKTTGFVTKALQELDREVTAADINNLTTESQRHFMAKAALTRARWMVEADRYDHNEIVTTFTQATTLRPKWESPLYHLGQYYQAVYLRAQGDNPTAELSPEGRAFQYHTAKCLVHSLLIGPKFIYQAMPKWLTIFLDFGSNKNLLKLLRSKRKSLNQALSVDEQLLERDFKKMSTLALKMVNELPVWQWITVLPQVVSRICHPHEEVYKLLEMALVRILRTHPQHAIWQMGGVVNSKSQRRAKRCQNIFNKAVEGQSQELKELIAKGGLMVNQMLHLSKLPVEQDVTELNLSITFPGLRRQCPSSLIVPLQNSLTVTLPTAVIDQFKHKPFPSDLPLILDMDDQIEIMSSLARPRKITISDQYGQRHSFLCKPNDDLRKDARLMEFNSMINKLLKSDSEARRRRLLIRTYCVLPLNEECGLIEWVPNTTGFRHIIARNWETKGVQAFSTELRTNYDALRRLPAGQLGQEFKRQILSRYPAVFHEWFLESFPEPSTWLKNRMAYTRTAAVMSMIGFVLGLGDRHGENILFDTTTGDTVHVDFNCLFDKGRTFEVAERVPFRLTQNMVDAFGITGVEGAFRRSCEISMRVLRESQESLMSVLEAFVHDPLLEFGSKKKKSSTSSNIDEAITEEARKALVPIKRKLQGFQTSSDPKIVSSYAATIESQVQNLIQEALALDNLGQMYIGWASFM